MLTVVESQNPALPRSRGSGTEKPAVTRDFATLARGICTNRIATVFGDSAISGVLRASDMRTLGAWRSHKDTWDDDDWDKMTTCSVPACPRKQPFSTDPSYHAHLRDIHHLKGDEKKQYVPVKENPKPVFGKRS
ncbi:MAG: hypothetical protein M1830_010407, partial [Pleopsidium flavum]